LSSEAKGEIRFYHLQRMAADRAMAMILGKVLERGQRALVLGLDPARLEELDAYLWRANPDSFLPHASAIDPAFASHAGQQPIWLALAGEGEASSPNGAQVLLQFDGAETAPEAAAGYATCCDLFDGQDQAAVVAARQRWVRYRDAGFSLSYWQETGSGGWECKAEHRPE
jgi:DNA polymerase III subunit chi